jgi:hypothetical protein
MNDTVKVKGQDVRVGDDLWSLGQVHRITGIRTYRHPVVTRGEDWRSAQSALGPGGYGALSWGITLEYDHGFAAGYEISVRPDEPPYVNKPPEDDYLSPHSGDGAALYVHYALAGFPGSWRSWLAKQDVPALLATEPDRSSPLRYQNSAGIWFSWAWDTGSWEFECRGQAAP